MLLLTSNVFCGVNNGAIKHNKEDNLAHNSYLTISYTYNNEEYLYAIGVASDHLFADPAINATLGYGNEMPDEIFDALHDQIWLYNNVVDYMTALNSSYPQYNFKIVPN